jgi:hypothetical protein
VSEASPWGDLLAAAAGALEGIHLVQEALGEPPSAQAAALRHVQRLVAEERRAELAAVVRFTWAAARSSWEAGTVAAARACVRGLSSRGEAGADGGERPEEGPEKSGGGSMGAG